MTNLPLLLLLVSACSGSASSAIPTTTPTPDPVPMPDPVVSTEPVEPVKATEPSLPDPETIRANLLAAETAAFEQAKPVFDKWCAKCHAKDGKATSAKKREHFDMTMYPFGGHHAMEVSGEIREALGLTGQAPTMPADKKGAVKGADLELIKAWANAFDASHQGGAHDGHAQPGTHKH